MRGKYICIEGPDGGGKSTLAKSLVQHIAELGGLSTYRWFPSDNPVGSLIRAGLRGEVELSQKAYLYLFCADGLQANKQIEENLANGYHVVCDRHPTLSGRVFQPDHHNLEDIENVYGAASEDGILHPDAIFILDVPAAVSLERMRGRAKYKDVVFESENIEKVRELQGRYLKMAVRYGATILSGELPTEELVQIIMQRMKL